MSNKNLVTGWEVDYWHNDESSRSRFINFDMFLSEKQLSECIPHIISPIYGYGRETKEY